MFSPAHYTPPYLIALMRLKLELFGQRKGLIEDLQKPLLIGALIQIVDARVETLDAFLARLDEIFVGRHVHH